MPREPALCTLWSASPLTWVPQARVARLRWHGGTQVGASPFALKPEVSLAYRQGSQVAWHLLEGGKPRAQEEAWGALTHLPCGKGPGERPVPRTAPGTGLGSRAWSWHGRCGTSPGSLDLCCKPSLPAQPPWRLQRHLRGALHPAIYPAHPPHGCQTHYPGPRSRSAWSALGTVPFLSSPVPAGHHPFGHSPSCSPLFG